MAVDTTQVDVRWIAEDVDDMLMLIDLDGRIEHINTPIDTLSRDQVIGSMLWAYLQPTHQVRFHECFARVRETGRPDRCASRYVSPTGEITDWDTRVGPARRGGELVGFVLVATNITERIKRAEERERLERELQQSRRMDAVGKLAGGVAHDFNNLLQAIRANAQLVERETSDPNIAAYVEQITAAVHSAAALTKQLLAYGKGEPLLAGRMDLGASVEKVLGMARRLMSPEIEVELALAEDLPRAWADRYQVEQVLMNLCLNACDAMPSGGRLSIATEREPASDGQPALVAVAVTDTGIGMTPELQARIFEPFFSTKSHAGAGLGLSTVAGIVRAHGGTLRVTSAPGRGSSFRATFPAADPEPAASAAIADAAAAPDGRVAATAAAAGHEAVLVAEDNDLVRRVIVNLLAEAGYHVVSASDGHEAVRIAADREPPFRLAILDMLMPGMSGPVVARALAEAHPQMKFLFVSGTSETAPLLQAGITNASILRKPFTQEELLARLREVLER